MLGKTLYTGMLGSVICFLVHHNETIRRSSFQLLCKLSRWPARGGPKENGWTSIFDFKNAPLMIKQSLILIMFCIREVANEEKNDKGYQLLNHILTNIRCVVLFGGNKNAGHSSDVMNNFLSSDNGETILAPCSGLMMLIVDDDSKSLGLRVNKKKRTIGVIG